ncbi:hypothetical protein TNCV_1527831 [Trichonephila clavipes]|nr:hypothetical protein TNCV_1527831 [Trichonephila clavipes]
MIENWVASTESLRSTAVQKPSLLSSSDLSLVSRGISSLEGDKVTRLLLCCFLEGLLLFVLTIPVFSIVAVLSDSVKISDVCVFLRPIGLRFLTKGIELCSCRVFAGGGNRW